MNELTPQADRAALLQHTCSTRPKGMDGRAQGEEGVFRAGEGSHED